MSHGNQECQSSLVVCCLSLQLQSSSSDEAISSKAEKVTEEEEQEELEPRTSVEIKEEAMEKINKAQRQIQLEKLSLTFETSI